MIGAVIVGILGVSVAALSVWMHINDKDGSGWGIMAFFLIIASCERSGGI